MLDDLRARLGERRMILDVTPEARRFIAREAETRIGRALLAGDVRDGAVINVTLDSGELAVSYENPS